jgi:MSHA pilin protein MshC
MRGFTMVELIMVIVIMGILAAVVGPRFFDRQVFDERLFYEEALSAVRYGQKLAVSSGCRIRAQVNASGYALTYAQACGGLASNAAVASPSGGNFSAPLPNGVSVGQSLDVTFTSLGNANVTSGTAQLGSHSFSVVADTGFINP